MSARTHQFISEPDSGAAPFSKEWRVRRRFERRVRLLGIPEDLFISIFAVARVPGYVVQVLEQQDKNILLRPLLNYVGPTDLEYVPIAERG